MRTLSVVVVLVLLPACASFEELRSIAAHPYFADVGPGVARLSTIAPDDACDGEHPAVFLGADEADRPTITVLTRGIGEIGAYLKDTKDTTLAWKHLSWRTPITWNGALEDMPIIYRYRFDVKWSDAACAWVINGEKRVRYNLSAQVRRARAAGLARHRPGIERGIVNVCVRSNGLPVEGATVVFAWAEEKGRDFADWSETGRGETDDQGHAEMLCAVGRVDVAISKTGLSSDRRWLRLDRAGSLDVSLFPEAKIEGRVLDAEGQAVPGTYVEVWGPRAAGDLQRPIAAATSDQEGGYSIGALVPGQRYLVSAQSQERPSEQRRFASIGVTAPSSADLVVVPPSKGRK